MDFRVLPYVKRHQVKAESIYTPQQTTHGEEASLLTFVFLETVGDQLNIDDELSDFFVRKNVVVIGRLQALLYQTQKYAVGHVSVTCGYSVIGIRKYATILIDLVEQVLSKRCTIG